jgi:multisubunit Na+/H+ antiporter MnhG subunit
MKKKILIILAEIIVILAAIYPPIVAFCLEEPLYAIVELITIPFSLWLLTRAVLSEG